MDWIFFNERNGKSKIMKSFLKIVYRLMTLYMVGITKIYIE